MCQVIHEAGLDSFYQRLQKRESTLAPPPDAPADIDQYDLQEVQQEFTQKLADGSSQARLLVEGIHCPSCVWLIEKALAGMPGIIKAEVNLVHHRLLLQWLPDTVSLPTIMTRLAALGYAAVPFNRESLEGSLHQQNRQLLFRLGFAGFAAMNIMWISIALYAGAYSGMSAEYRQFFHWVSFAIATPVLLYSGGPILLSAWRGLIRGKLAMDLPITIGALSTFTYSSWQTIQGGVHVYFDTVVSFLFVILIGRYLEVLARRNASSATLRLLELQPRMATRFTVNGGEERIAVRQLKIGDRLHIKPGDKVPADGMIMDGNSHIDESMLTGEAKPAHKQCGDHIAAGTLNAENPLIMQVEKIGSATVLARIIHLVESAQGSKARIQRIADRIVPWFVSITLTLAALTFTYWWIASGFDTALLAATAVLIITCPCALGLATPMAIAVSTGFAAKHGVLVRNGESLERLSQTTHVVLDKTGTLTTGNMRVSEITLVCKSYHHDSSQHDRSQHDSSQHDISHRDRAHHDNIHHHQTSKEKLLQFAAALERHYSHPLANAVCASLEATTLHFPDCSDAQLLPGMGVGGTVDGQQVWVGNQRLMHAKTITIPDFILALCETIETNMATAVLVAVNGELLGLLHIEDHIRDAAFDLIKHLSQRNIAITLLSGDSVAAAKHLQQQLCNYANSRPIRVIAGVLPEGKVDQIIALQKQGEHVLMVGDGINDAPALAQANVSIAMGSGTDISMECSDVILMGSDLARIPWALDLGARTIKTIHQNLTLSLLYNILLVPAAMAAWVTPIFAALAMPLSSLLVIGNAILIKRHLD